MDINIGDRILYKFPNPILKEQKSVVGTVESIDDFYVILKTEDNIRLKVTFKNFDYLKKIANEKYDNVA